MRLFDTLYTPLYRADLRRAWRCILRAGSKPPAAAYLPAFEAHAAALAITHAAHRARAHAVLASLHLRLSAFLLDVDCADADAGAERALARAREHADEAYDGKQTLLHARMREHAATLQLVHGRPARAIDAELLPLRSLQETLRVVDAETARARDLLGVAHASLGDFRAAAALFRECTRLTHGRRERLELLLRCADATLQLVCAEARIAARDGGSRECSKRVCKLHR